MRGSTRWYHGWNIVALCVLIQCASLGVSINCMTFFLEDWSREFKMPVSEIVLALPLFSIVSCAMQPWVGAMVAKHPAKTILSFAIIMTAASMLLIGSVTAGWQIIAIYTLLFPFAIGFSGGTPTQTLVSRWFVRRRGLAFSISAMGLVIAGVLLPPIVVWMKGLVGWRETWWIFGILILIFVVGAIRLFVRERPGEEEGAYYIGPPSDGPPEADLSFREILKRRNFWIVIAVFIPVMMPSSALTANFAPLVTSRGLTTADAAILVGVFNAAAALGKLATGALSDRFGNRMPLILTAILAAAATFSIAFAHSFLALFVGFMILGITNGMWVLMAACNAEEFGSANFPRALGAACMFSVVASLVSPLVALTNERTGSYTPAIVLLAAFGLLAVVASLFYRPRRSQLP